MLWFETEVLDFRYELPGGLPYLGAIDVGNVSLRLSFTPSWEIREENDILIRREIGIFDMRARIRTGLR